MNLKGGKAWIRFVWHMTRTSTDFCEHGDQLSVSINCEGFFDHLWECQFVKRESETWSRLVSRVRPIQ
jgi:hypothetical protein